MPFRLLAGDLRANGLDSQVNDWWDTSGELFAMGALLDSMRFPYFYRVLTHTLLHDLSELSVLDVGCGGGSLTFHFARAGCHVVGVDSDPNAIECARAQALDRGRAVDFHVARAEKLPFAAASFDVVVCSEVLEHVDDTDSALDELYRVLRFGGVLLFSTPNRSIWSYLGLIWLAQDCELTRVMSIVEHDYKQLIRPDELSRALERRGVDVYETTGVSIPLRAIPGALAAYLRFKRGRVPLATLARSLRLRAGGSKRLAYIGWGIKYG